MKTKLLIKTIFLVKELKGSTPQKELKEPIIIIIIKIQISVENPSQTNNNVSSLNLKINFKKTDSIKENTKLLISKVEHSGLLKLELRLLRLSMLIFLHKSPLSVFKIK